MEDPQGQPLPPHLTRVQQTFDAAAAASTRGQVTMPSHTIARLQGAAMEMAMHADTAGRAYACNLVWRQASDGTGGTVDFMHTSRPSVVYRIVFTEPSVYIMSAVGGGIMSSTSEHHWAHGVSTHALGERHMLCALVVEYKDTTLTAMVAALKSEFAGIPGSSRPPAPVVVTDLPPVLAAWPPSPKTVISKLLGKLGGKWRWGGGGGACNDPRTIP